MQTRAHGRSAVGDQEMAVKRGVEYGLAGGFRKIPIIGGMMG